jgi:peptide deformylase
MELLKYPDPLLSKPSKMMANGFTPAVKGRIRSLLRLMDEINGFGLAAVQVGWPVRLFVMNFDEKEISEKTERVFINPVVKFPGSEMNEGEESCFSLPGVTLPIKRFEVVEVSAFTPTGMDVESFTGQAARIVQHEMDHLDGILITDRFSKQKEGG